MQAKTQNIFYIGLSAVALILMLYIVRDYLTIIVIGLTLSVIFLPVHRKLQKYLKHEALAALLTTLLVFLIVLLPLTLFGYNLFKEARGFYDSLNNDLGSNVFINHIVDFFKSSGSASGLSIDLNQYLRNAASYVLQNLGSIFSSIVRLIFTFVLILVALFFMLKDGQKLRVQAMRISPLSDDVDNKIAERMAAGINSIIRGQIAIAIAQAILCIIGFSIFGIPNPVLWGSTALFAALVPSLGTSIVLAPAILFLYFSGHTTNAIGLLVWGVLAVGLIDNFLGPYIINRGVKIHPLIILLAVLGGVSTFGPIGFIIGPIVLVFLFALYEVRGLLIN